MSGAKATFLSAAFVFLTNPVVSFAQQRSAETSGEANLVLPDLHQATFFGGMIDGIADCGIGRTCAFGSHIAFRRKAGHEVVPGSQRRKDCSLRHRLLNGLQIFRARMQK